MDNLQMYRKSFGSVIVMLMCCIIITALLCPGYEIAAHNNEWGICFETPGEKPTIDISEEVLEANDAYYMGDDQKKYVYLTFDAGYENGFTPKILDILKKTEVPAAFFLIGAYIQKNPDIVERMVEEGHIVANHTMNHPEKYVLEDKGELRKQLELTEAEYLKATGFKMPKYYRPPCGKHNKNSLRAAKELGYKTIFWSLAYNDYDEYNRPSNWAAMKKLTSCIHPGAVVMLHSTCRTNVDILEELINQYKGMGYKFKSLDTLVKSRR